MGGERGAKNQEERSEWKFYGGGEREFHANDFQKERNLKVQSD